MTIEYQIKKQNKIYYGTPKKLCKKLGVGYSYFMRQYRNKQPCRGYWITRTDNYSKASHIYAYYEHGNFVSEGTYKELAKFLGVSEGSLRQLERRGRNHIVKNPRKEVFKIDTI